MTGSTEKPTPSKNAWLFVFLTVVLDSIGLALILPVMPELIMELTGEGASEAARYGGWLVVTFASMQFLFSPFVGNLSDRFGRRPVLLLSLSVYGMNYFLMGWAPSLGWLFLGRVASGITGATYSTANAYVADVSPPETRAQNFGMMGAGFGIGFVLGPVLGGVLGEFGTRVPFYAAACVALLNTLYGFFVLPESLPPEKRRKFEWTRANPLGAMIHLRRYPSLFNFALILFLWQLAHSVYPATWSYFAVERFSWSEAEIGYSLGFVGLTMAFVQGYLTRVLIPRMGKPRAAVFGLTFGVLSFLGFAFASQGWMMYGVILLSGLAGFVQPSIHGIVSSQVPADSQGELQGVLSSLGSVAAIFGPLFLTQLFSYCTRESSPIYFPGAAFLAAGGLAFICLLLIFGALRKLKNQEAESAIEAGTST